MQKMVHHLIAVGELESKDLPGLTDSELIGIMHSSKEPLVQTMYSLLKRRELFREAIVIRPERFVDARRKTEKSVAILPAKKNEIKHLATSSDLKPENQANLEMLENKIAAIAELPKDSVLVTPVVGQERFEGKDVLIYQGRGKKPASLKNRYPAHFKNIEEVAQAHLAFRVATTEKYRKRLSETKIAKKVFELVVGQ